MNVIGTQTALRLGTWRGGLADLTKTERKLTMKIKYMLFVAAIGIALATPESMQAQAKPKPVKPDVGDVKDDAKEAVSYTHLTLPTKA